MIAANLVTQVLLKKLPFITNMIIANLVTRLQFTFLEPVVIS
jgi:hypothetical protein